MRLLLDALCSKPKNMLIGTVRDLGGFARDRRKQLRWSQTELAEKLGTSRSWVSDMENGKETTEIGLVLRALQVLGLIVELREPRVERAGPASAEEEYRNIIVHSVRGDTVRGPAEGRPALTRGGKSLLASRGARRLPRRMN